MIRVAVAGCAGRMGQAVVDAVNGADDMELVCGIDPYGTDGCTYPVYDDVASAIAAEEFDVMVDFTQPDVVAGNIRAALPAGIDCVIGTTGLTAEAQKAVDEAAKRIPVVQSGNYSLGVNLLLELVRKAAEVLGPEYDVEVTEMHHRHKKDAPSGTALMLAKSVAAGRGVGFAGKAIYGRHGEPGERPSGEIAIHALRGGSVVGDHTVMFAGDVERVELTHRAQSREAFAAGALRSVVWAAGRAPGMYNMRHVLGFE